MSRARCCECSRARSVDFRVPRIKSGGISARELLLICQIKLVTSLRLKIIEKEEALSLANQLAVACSEDGTQSIYQKIIDLDLPWKVTSYLGSILVTNNFELDTVYWAGEKAVRGRPRGSLVTGAC